MSVTTTSAVIFMRQTRAGTFTLTRFDHMDDETGEPICTSFSGGMLRGIPLGTASVGKLPAGFSELTAVSHSDSHKVPLSLDRSLPHTYSECARIWNPIHTERAVALAAGLEDIIVHGTITWALSAREAFRLSGVENLGRLKRLAASFRAPIIAGRPMTVLVSQKHGSVVRFSAQNEKGAPILAGGLIEIVGH
ncbi:MaoC/PaaZ C-terminal domain-containing protein [Bradyrhizobium sp. WSM2793]|uniref:MaoC/PaaZ C-terminal domain-containing protein n=1 Tax=Bradyrhizobium sp. WSM2793 TaxID=1038866 RepID=UPI00035D291A|nr:MaoC/PaaZ C-terminal domain-containing protein [Bradyrhizobium sp. WSM2793]